MPINALTAGVAALAINSTAFTIEIFRGRFAEKQNLEDDEQRDVADDFNIDGGNSAREAVVGNPHQRADEAERKAQGEASALISTVRKAPQPSAGK